MEVVCKLLSEKFNLNMELESAYRIGSSQIIHGRRQHRHIIIRVKKFEDKIKIMKQKIDCLKDTNYYMVDDLTDYDLVLKKKFKPLIDDARMNKKPWKFRNGKLIVDGRLMTLNDIQHTDVDATNPTA